MRNPKIKCPKCDKNLGKAAINYETPLYARIYFCFECAKPYIFSEMDEDLFKSMLGSKKISF